MSEPTKEEINKCLAEYMDLEWDRFSGVHRMQKRACLKKVGNNPDYKVTVYGSNYTDSLDALVPVWGRLGLLHLSAYSWGDFQFNILGKGMSRRVSGEGVANTIQHAAALATYKAIKELGEI